jgi:hypothetical protein
MPTYEYARLELPNRLTTLAEQPCPVCGATDTCCVLEDGLFAVCQSIASERPETGGGWVHRLPPQSPATTRCPTSALR